MEQPFTQQYILKSRLHSQHVYFDPSPTILDLMALSRTLDELTSSSHQYCAKHHMIPLVKASHFQKLSDKLKTCFLPWMHYLLYAKALSIYKHLLQKRSLKAEQGRKSLASTLIQRKLCCSQSVKPLVHIAQQLFKDRGHSPPHLEMLRTDPGTF